MRAGGQQGRPPILRRIKDGPQRITGSRQLARPSQMPPARYLGPDTYRSNSRVLGLVITGARSAFGVSDSHGLQARCGTAHGYISCSMMPAALVVRGGDDVFHAHVLTREVKKPALSPACEHLNSPTKSHPLQDDAPPGVEAPQANSNVAPQQPVVQAPPVAMGAAAPAGYHGYPPGYDQYAAYQQYYQMYANQAVCCAMISHPPQKSFHMPC